MQALSHYFLEKSSITRESLRLTFTARRKNKIRTMAVHMAGFDAKKVVHGQPLKKPRNSRQFPKRPTDAAAKCWLLMDVLGRSMTNARICSGNRDELDREGTTVFLKDVSEFAKMNEVYATYFKNAPPARATVEVAHLPRDMKIEISAIAVHP
jgi:hypothetical protein